MSETTTYAVYEQQTPTLARRLAGGMTEATAHARRALEVERGGSEGALFVEVDSGEIIDSEPPQLANDFEHERDVTVTEMFTTLPGEVALKVEGYRTIDGQTLGFLLAVSLPKGETIFIPYEGTWGGKRNEEVSRGIWEYLADEAEELLPVLKLEAVRNMFSTADTHACTRCGKCGRTFDDAGNEVTGPRELEVEDDVDDSDADGHILFPTAGPHSAAN